MSSHSVSSSPTITEPDCPTEGDDRRQVSDRRLALARIGWIVLTLLALVLFAAGVWLHAEEIGGLINQRALLDLEI